MKANTWREPKHFAQRAIDQCHEAIFWHRGHQIVYVNEQACRSLGYTKRELESMSLDDIDDGLPSNDKRQIMDEIMRTGSAVFETMNRRKDGTTFPVELSCTLHNVDGEQLFCGIARDITERKAAETELQLSKRLLEEKVEELRRSEQRYRALSEATFDGIVISRNGKVCDVNESFATAFGMPKEVAIGMSVSDLTDPDSMAVVREHMASEYEEPYEFVGVRSDGKRLDVEVVGRTIEEDGEKTRISALRDISAQKQAELQLELAMKAGALGTFKINLTNGSMVVSDSFYRLFGLKPGEITPTYDVFLARIFPGDCPALDGLPEQIREEDGVTEIRIVQPDNSIRWAEKRAAVAHDRDGTPIRIDGAIVDITEKKEAQEIQRRSQQTLQMALNAGKMGTWELDLVNGIATGSTESHMITGIDATTPRSLADCMDSIHPDDRQRINDVMQTTLVDGGDFTNEFRVRADKGEYRWVEVRGEAKRNDEGDVVSLVGLIADIEQRKTAEQELQLRRFAVEMCTEPMFTLRIDGSFVDFNHAAHHGLGFTSDEFKQMSVVDIDVTGLFQSHARPYLLKTGQFTGDGQHRCKDRSIIDVQISAVVFHYDGTKYICATARDVTELRRSESEQRRLGQQLAHLNRLSSMNQMVSAIAHELNQPLAVIGNNAAILSHIIQTTSFDPDEDVELIDTITSQAVVAGQIVRRMREFCMDKPPANTKECIAEVIHETLDLMAPELVHSSINVEINCTDLPRINLDRVQIQQVLVNLVQNAIDAMSDCDSKSRCLRVTATLCELGSVCIKIADSGPGLATELLDNLFEPFHSTKPDGMGIGLAISRSIVEAHGGNLRLEQQTSAGTMFVIMIPVNPMEPAIV